MLSIAAFFIPPIKKLLLFFVLIITHTSAVIGDDHENVPAIERGHESQTQNEQILQSHHPFLESVKIRLFQKLPDLFPGHFIIKCFTVRFVQVVADDFQNIQL